MAALVTAPPASRGVHNQPPIENPRDPHTMIGGQPHAFERPSGRGFFGPPSEHEEIVAFGTSIGAPPDVTHQLYQQRVHGRENAARDETFVAAIRGAMHPKGGR